MTVAVYDGRSLAADRMALSDGMRLEPRCKLIVVEGVGAFVGVGDALGDKADERTLRMIADGADPPENAFGLALLKDGRAFMVQCGGLRQLGKPRALGSGQEVATGALRMGADARRAAEIACEEIATCGDGVDVYTP